MKCKEDNIKKDMNNMKIDTEVVVVVRDTTWIMTKWEWDKEIIIRKDKEEEEDITIEMIEILNNQRKDIMI